MCKLLRPQIHCYVKTDRVLMALLKFLGRKHLMTEDEDTALQERTALHNVFALRGDEGEFIDALQAAPAVKRPKFGEESAVKRSNFLSPIRPN